METQNKLSSKNRIILAYTLAVLISGLLSSKTGNIFSKLSSQYLNVDASAFDTRGELIDGFFINLCLLLPLLLASLTTLWKGALLMSIVSLLPVFLLFLLDGDFGRYLIFLLSLSIAGFLLGLGIRAIATKITPSPLAKKN